MSMNIVTLLYLVASVFFIQALKGLSHPTTSIRGNIFGMAGMTIAVLTTGALIVETSGGKALGMVYVLTALLVGGAAGTLMAKRVEMTKMPELVAFMVFTGVAGGLGVGVNVGDVVVASDFVQHDIDASPLFPRYEVPLYGRSRFEGDAALTGLLFNAATAALGDGGASADFPGARVHRGLIASGDRFVSGAGESRSLHD